MKTTKKNRLYRAYIGFYRGYMGITETKNVGFRGYLGIYSRV